MARTKYIKVNAKITIKVYADNDIIVHTKNVEEAQFGDLVSAKEYAKLQSVSYK